VTAGALDDGGLSGGRMLQEGFLERMGGVPADTLTLK